VQAETIANRMTKVFPSIHRPNACPQSLPERYRHPVRDVFCQVDNFSALGLQRN
jgi:hypothetical protein